jgi:hypothetical protein
MVPKVKGCIAAREGVNPVSRTGRRATINTQYLVLVKHGDEYILKAFMNSVENNNRSIKQR